MDKWLNRLSNLAVIVIAAALIYVLVGRFAGGERPAVDRYEPGDRIDTTGTPIKGPALLIVTRSGCSFCTESLQFYGSLSGISMVWVAVGEDAASNRRYLESHGLKPQTVITVEESGLIKVRSTPTLILMGPSGRVVRSWVGKLSSDRESELIRMLKGV
jgi:hypothetical protein